MTFRFGNNGVVPCRRALMVPVDRFWIKIAVVESRTPFLISNNVCRSLGAVIDTTNQTIFFRELNCTLPLTLSGKKLFLLEFSELVAQRPPQPSVAIKPEGPRAENVCVCVDKSTQGSVLGLPGSLGVSCLGWNGIKLCDIPSFG